MPYQRRKPRSFGADDKLACPNCSKPMSLRDALRTLIMISITSDRFSLAGPVVTRLSAW